MSSTLRVPSNPPCGCWTTCGPTVASTWETGWEIWRWKAGMPLGCLSSILLCLSFPRALRVTRALPGLVAFRFAKGPVRFGVELNTLLSPSWGGGRICSPLPPEDECAPSPSPQVQGVPGGAVAAVALPPAALLGFLVAASPEHRLPPPHPRPGAAATAACAIAQGLAGAGGEAAGGHRLSVAVPSPCRKTPKP